MKKQTVIIFSILLILIPAFLIGLKGMIVTSSTIAKEEKRFCPPTPIDIIQPENRKLIKTGDLSFECHNLDKTRREIENTVKRYDGFIAKERLYYGYDKKTSNQDLKIRVPAEHFDALVSDISKGAKHIDQRVIEIEDVTDQYFDIETRLSVKRQLETRYRELLSDARDVTDILNIEEQLANVREEIESAEGQLKRLDDRIILSTLDITYYIHLDDSPGFSAYFKNGFGNGWNNLLWFAVALLNIWPFILSAIILILGFRFHRKRNAV
ncbi:DUF4349 domain-containing protein [Pontiella agarivorans]|uniref:DUF4349 domain-containing protein n=1 Tax=Pontiella agarivorans TaxID=3038953 RepID=A0ABU5N170_9BACT|nr:DUF4349 domain-containing protein [Pontiella agarivorans]MDZ8120209.1 DUF4349 domain-containing protein [Pontiella agarivorans]